MAKPKLRLIGSSKPKPAIKREGLMPQHEELLKARAIAPEVAKIRGYSSIYFAAHAIKRGFSEAQAKIVEGSIALLIPIYRLGKTAKPAFFARSAPFPKAPIILSMSSAVISRGTSA